MELGPLRVALVVGKPENTLALALVKGILQVSTNVQLELHAQLSSASLSSVGNMVHIRSDQENLALHLGLDKNAFLQVE